jgi:hypothetical protein
MTTTRYQDAALKAGDWLLKTQRTKYDDANRGRFFYAVNLETGYIELSTGWQTGFAVIALLSLHRLSGEKRHLEAAKLGIDYIKTLQVLDPRRKNLIGAIREETPQTNWLHPRDALSAAWAMLAYGTYANDRDCLERAVLFGDWLMSYGMRGDWPLCTVNLGPGGHDSDDLQGSFQSGGILFFIDLYKATQDMRYYDMALRMSNYYVENFIDDSGRITVLIDPIGNNPGVNDNDKWPLAWQRMHQVNDDFGGIALAGSYELFRQESYRQRLSAYFAWLQAAGNGDGSFLEPVMEVGSATVPIFLNSYAKLAPQSEQPAIETLRTQSLDFLLSLQQHVEADNVNGAFLGMDNKCRDGLGKWVNIRCSAYAIIALLQPSGHAGFPL